MCICRTPIKIKHSTLRKQLINKLFCYETNDGISSIVIHLRILDVAYGKFVILVIMTLTVIFQWQAWL